MDILISGLVFLWGDTVYEVGQRKKAKEAKQKAIQAYLEAKRIKNTYLIDEIDTSDDSDDDNLPGV